MTALAARILELHRGELLEGDDAPWARAAREQLRRRTVGALAILAAHEERQGRLEEAADLFHRGADLDPGAELFTAGLRRCDQSLNRM